MHVACTNERRIFGSMSIGRVSHGICTVTACGICWVIVSFTVLPWEITPKEFQQYEQKTKFQRLWNDFVRGKNNISSAWVEKMSVDRPAINSIDRWSACDEYQTAFVWILIIVHHDDNSSTIYIKSFSIHIGRKGKKSQEFQCYVIPSNAPWNGTNV